MIKLQNLSYAYQENSPFETSILKDVNISIDGSKVLVLGKSGSGKSTFFKILMGNIKVSKKMLIKPSNIAIVMQNVNSQILCNTIYDELNIGYSQKYAKDVSREQIKEVFDRFGIDFDLEMNPQQLSGGQKKLLIIICMVLINPEIIIFDEPLVGLDLHHRKLVLKFIKQTKTKLLISTHDIENLVQLCDQIILVNEQNIIKTSEAQVRKLEIINPRGESCEL